MSAQELRDATTDKKQNPVAMFRGFLEKQKSQMAAALPSHISPDRMIRLACTEFSKNPALQKCTQVSVFGAIIQASQLGLEVGVLGQAYLVPYRNNKTNTMEAQFIPGYKGLISLARRSGEVSSIETHIVYENDEFDLVLGIDSNLRHKPQLDSDRGQPRLVYGVAKFKDGGHHLEWMSIADVNKIRARSKASGSGPWVTDYEQMVRKTLIRRMANYLPMSIEFQSAIQIDDAVSDGKQAALDGDFIVITGDDDTDDNKLDNKPKPREEQKDTPQAASKPCTEIEKLISMANTLADFEAIDNLPQWEELSKGEAPKLRHFIEDQKRSMVAEGAGAEGIFGN